MDYKNIDLDENIILKNKIPLLIEDKNWIKLFGATNNRSIQHIKEELSKLVEKQRELNKIERALQREKVHAMKMILGVSDAINNENKTHNIGLLDEYKEKIESINGELEDIAFRLETIPQEIRELNFNLLKATVFYGYKDLKSKQKRLTDVIDELDIIRERMKYLINEKYDYEEWIDSTYSFLHGMLGSEEMERLDNKILE